MLKTTPNITDMNMLDARALTGSATARQQQAAWVRSAQQNGLPATSATNASIMLSGLSKKVSANIDSKAQTREAATMIRELLADGDWPTTVTIPIAGKMETIQINSQEEAEQLLASLETQLASHRNESQLANIDMQNMLQKQQQTLQMMSNIEKMLKDTAMAVIRKIG